jgi:hypothetical protein
MQGRTSGPSFPGSVILVVSRVISTYHRVLPLLAAALFALGSGLPLRLAASWTSASGEDRNIVHGVLFEQPCAVEVEDGVIAQCGNLVHNKQPR